MGEDTFRESLEAEITYILTGPKFGIPEGYCYMSLQLDYSVKINERSAE